MSVPVTDEMLEKAVDIFARSFIDYPYPGGVIPDVERRRKALSIMYSEILKDMKTYADIVADSSECKGVGVWCKMGDLKGNFHIGRHIRVLLSCMKLREIATLIKRTIQIEGERVKQNLPDDTVYMCYLGVAPECQGQGIASKLIREKLAECDEKGLTAYLETNTEHNVKIYSKYGFVEINKVVNERDGFTTWYMIRKPAAEQKN
ncbi:MAG TPA: GNAT family N-acetyltransferase [Methanocorpusculum sp.]|nr:GNAT family N-acetyltransferase [Methanocorpusculum sp.]